MTVNNNIVVCNTALNSSDNLPSYTAKCITIHLTMKHNLLYEYSHKIFTVITGCFPRYSCIKLRWVREKEKSQKYHREITQMTKDIWMTLTITINGSITIAVVLQLDVTDAVIVQ